MRTIHLSGPVAALALIAALATTSLAHAGPSEAQERFEEGRALLKAGRPADAIPKFIASIASEPTLAALLNLADCYERIGKLASAHAKFREAQGLAKEKDPIRSEEARKRAEILEPRLSTLTLVPPVHPEGVRVWIDGTEIPRLEWGKPQPEDPGPHEVLVQDPRGGRQKQVVDVGAEAARITVPIETTEPSATTTTPPPAPKPTPPPADEPSPMRTIGLVTAGVGVAALGTGVVTGILALGASAELKDACASYPSCPADRRGELVDLDDRARTFGTVSTITLIAGSVFVIAGAVLYLTSSSPSPRQGTRAARPWARGWELGAW